MLATFYLKLRVPNLAFFGGGGGGGGGGGLNLAGINFSIDTILI